MRIKRYTDDIFKSKMVDIMDWRDDDPRIHKNVNCRYRDSRTALDIICELTKNNMITCDYLKSEE